MLTTSITSMTLFVSTILALLTTTDLQHIEAICLYVSIFEDYTRYDATFRVKVLKKINTMKECKKDKSVPCKNAYWVVKLKSHYGPGCAPSKKFVVATPKGFGCGGFFVDVDRAYLIVGDKMKMKVQGMDVYEMNACSASGEWKYVTEAQQEFLEGRSIDCDGRLSCATTDRTERFEDETCAPAEACPDHCAEGKIDKWTKEPKWTIACIPTSVCEKCGATPLLYKDCARCSNKDPFSDPEFLDSCSDL